MPTESAPDSAGAAQPDGITLRVEWVDWASTPLQYANQFILQQNGPEVFLTIGALAPPTLAGTQEEMRAQAEALEFVPAHIVARLVLTVEGSQLLAGALNTHLDRLGLQPRLAEGSAP